MKLLAIGVAELVAPTALLIAQSSGEFDPVSLLGQIGLGAIFAVPWFYLWRDERKQRISSEERERTFMREMGPMLTRAVDVLDAVAQGVEGTVNRAGSDADIQQRRAELLVGELGDLVRGLKHNPQQGK